MNKRVYNKIFKWAGRAFLGLFLFLFLIIAALYIPAVQDFIVPKVLDKVNSSSEMTISVEKFRLRFPLDVSVDGVSVMQKGDTVLLASSADVNVALFPLLSGEVYAKGLLLRDVFFKTGSPDSALYLRANVGMAKLNRTGVKLAASDVSIDDLDLKGGRIEIALKQDTTPPSPASETNWKIHAMRLSLGDIDYRMTLSPSIDSLNAKLGSLILLEGVVDLSGRSADISHLLIDGVNARFITPMESLPHTVDLAPDTAAVDSLPWTIKLGHLSLKNGSALYAKSEAVPADGLDLNYLSLSNINVEIDSLYNKASEMTVPLRKLSAIERSGLSLESSGLFVMTESGMSANGFSINTNASSFDLDAILGTGVDDPGNSPVDIRIGADISVSDLQIAFPGMKEILAQLPRNRKIGLDVSIDGTMADMSIKRVAAEIPDHLDVTLSGRLANATDFDRMDGSVKIDGDLVDIDFIKPALMDVRTRRNVNLPSLKLSGKANVHGGTVNGGLQAVTAEGEIAMDASWNGSRQNYDVVIDADRFPVRSFLPESGIGDVTAGIKVKGRGLDVFDRNTSVEACVDASNIEYKRAVIHDFVLEARLSDGNADISVKSDNPAAKMDLTASGNLSGEKYNWNVGGEIARLDLYRLGLSDSLFDISTAFDGQFSVSPKYNNYIGRLGVSELDVAIGSSQHFSGDHLDVSFEASDSATSAVISNNDLHIDFSSPVVLDSVVTRMSNSAILVGRQVESRKAGILELQRSLPPFRLHVNAGRDNILSRYLSDNGTALSSVEIGISNDSVIALNAKLDTLVSGSTRLDHIILDSRQYGEFLRYKAIIDNNPGTMDNFAYVQANGYLAGDKLAVFLKQRDIEDKTGYSLGGVIAMTDSTMQLKFVPFRPVIGYKEWTVNKDNYIRVNTRSRHIDANLSMKSDESAFHLYTVHDSLSQSDGQEDIVLNISDIKIADWIAVNPYAPPVKGDLSANMRFALSPTSINGSGTVTLSELFYGKNRVGTLDLDIDLTTMPSGTVLAETAMKVDGDEVMTAKGNLNDTTSVNPFLLDFELSRFPLSIANPFIGASTGSVGGYLNGKMDITGSLSAPQFNGYLDFDSASVNIKMLGTTFHLSEEKIPVDSNVIRFDNYSIYGVNDNPLTIKGSLDLRSMSDIGVDLAMKARDMQVIGHQKKRGSDVYGKAYISLDSKAYGTMGRLKADAMLTVMPGTNVTYIIPGGTSALSGASDNNMVRFVNFSDTTAVASADSVVVTGSAIDLTAVLKIAQGATISVDLSSSGQNKAQVQSSGTLEYTMNYMGDTRFTGRLNIDGGFVRYTPPFMSEKLFNFEEGSYVAFNGDMMNPQLNVKAVDRMKANVTQEGQNSRLVNFDVAIAVTGSLQNMDVAFDLSTGDDITVENELQAMSPEQRANQAMNLLLYNVYTGPGTKGNTNLSGNPLFSFLESKLNSWMANNVKGVDISFGIDQYDRTVDGASSTTTSYSYKVSKSFLNDRFKVVVGGNYSTDANADENFSQNLINDISFEYMLNRSGSMYIRLFRHTGYESILEGEITQTGVGFVYKRKLRTLRDLFRFGHRPAPESNDKEPVAEQGVITRKNDGKNE